MAVASDASIKVSQLLQVQLCCASARQTAEFYEEALGFRRIGVEHLSDAHVHKSFGIGGSALRITLALGAQRIILVQFVDQPGQPYPRDAGSSDLIFQHFAIVASDMAAAMTQLQGTTDWTPITRGGPQTLPKSSGGVTAFKFRDPEGHPLELLAFPAENIPNQWQGKMGDGISPFRGIDHSAISVSDIQDSIAFYDMLGLSVLNRSVNEGPEQARLDNLDQPLVEVTAMAAAGNATPHLELLCYREPGKRSKCDLNANDVAATCLLFGASDRTTAGDAHTSPVRYLQDPDGHRLAFVEQVIE
jgi:catechol 2,3-dioxygenase-like lactoylglutathione lyase family enzyme